MKNEVKINLSCEKEIRDKLKEIASSKGMKFHPYIQIELQKIAERENKKKVNYE